MSYEPLSEALILTEQDMSEARGCAIGAGLTMVQAMRCPSRLSANEDSAVLIPCGDQACVLAVADGLGGALGGAQASALAVTCLAEEVSRAAQAKMDDLREPILNAFEWADQTIRDLGIGAGTTLTAVEIFGDSFRAYHVGDSMLLVVGQRGKMKFQSVCHSPVGFAVEAGLMSEKEAMHHEHRHVVSNVVGMPGMSVEIGSRRKLRPNDTVLLATDGLIDNLHTGEIVERMRKGSLPLAALRLAEDARGRMTDPEANQPSKPDDLTFIVYRPGRSET